MALVFPPSVFTPGPLQCLLAHHKSEVWSQAAAILQQIADLNSTRGESRFTALSSHIFALDSLHHPSSSRSSTARPLIGLQEAVKSLESTLKIDFFSDLLPSIANAALRLPSYPISLPLLPTGAPFAELRIPRDFGHVLLANTFLGNHQNVQSYAPQPRSWGCTSWLPLMTSNAEVGVERIKCHLAYFHAVASLPRLDGEILIRRVSANFADQLRTCDVKFQATVIHGGAMENRGNVIVDFANCRLHINSIIPSATQEEVLFSVRPECFLGMMVCQQMDPCDVILIQGARQIVGYKGYALSFVYDGILDVPFGDACGEVVLAIDSAIGRAFDPKTGNRDMNKAAVGFAACRDLVGDAVISTGGWGTGAFGQDHSVKFLHQIIAAAAAGVKLEYAAFFKPAEEARYKELMEGVLRATPRVCDLWAVIQADLDSKGDFEAALVKAGICKGR